MTHIMQAVREAIEAGYWGYKDKCPTGMLLELNSDGVAYRRKPEIVGDGTIYKLLRFWRDFDTNLIMLDPAFWQALGKARGWNEHAMNHNMHWHCFIDHLADGKDAENFFATLV